MSNVVVNANGGGAPNMLLMEEDEPSSASSPEPLQAPAAFPRMPASEAEADEMVAASLGNDPARMRMAAEEFTRKMHKMADALDGGVAVVEEPQTSQAYSTPAQAAPIEQAAGTELPTGYMFVPENLFNWAPESWGGRPLHGVPDRAIERDNRPILIVFVLLSPAFARNRAGRIVSLPAGASVVIHAGTSWANIVPLTKVTEGRPVLWVVPTAMGDDGKIRPANPGEEILRFSTGDGGYENGLVIMYDPDPKDPTKPRLISLETLHGAKR